MLTLGTLDTTYAPLTFSVVLFKPGVRGLLRLFNNDDILRNFTLSPLYLYSFPPRPIQMNTPSKKTTTHACYRNAVSRQFL